MRKLATIFLAITTVIFGGLYFLQGHQTRAKHAKIVLLEEELRNKASETENYEFAVRKLREEKATAVEKSEKLQGEIGKFEDRVRKLEDQLSPIAKAQPDTQKELLSPFLKDDAEGEKTFPGTKGFAKSLAQMMKDPGMKKMIRQQQKAAMDIMYGNFFEKLGLSQEETDIFKNLLVEKQMSNMELGMSFMEDNLDEVRKQEIEERVRKEQEKVDAQIRELLGEEQFTDYEEYQKTLPERISVNQLKQRLAGANAPLEDYQEEQLVQAMKEEREDFPFTMDFGDPNDVNYGAFSEENMDSYFQEKEELNRRTLERVRGILTSEQLEVFKAHQEQQLSFEKMALQMATMMFGSEEESEEKSE